MEVHMPLDSIMVGLAAVAMFATIAFILTWGSHKTHDL